MKTSSLRGFELLVPCIQNQTFLPESAGTVFHGFFTRKGGASEGLYASLNCGSGSSDNPGHVRENRRRVAETCGVAPDNLLSLHQIHSAECLEIEAPFPPDQRPKADAFVTGKPGIALSILTADCAPVLFYGESAGGPLIGAAHAGWRGAFGGVLENTAQAMTGLGCRAETIRAAIGPCIALASYEVDAGFYRNFLSADPENESFFRGGKAGAHYFDLSGYCAARLAKAGVGNVSISGHDTYAEEQKFFSYRRATHEKAPDYGRQISVIVWKA